MAHYVITIDGKVVDLGNANITLTWKSNLFTDLSKITGNHSYTINLPKSQTNTMIFGVPDMPGFNSAKVRKFLPATIEIDGILITDSARAVLTSVDSGSYSVALTWGLGVAIQKIADAGKTLQELVDLDESLAWDSTSTLMTYGTNSNYGFAYADYGFKTLPPAASRSIYYHPCVSAKWILSKIATQHSASVSLPSDFDALLKKLYIPLITRKDSSSIAASYKRTRTYYDLYDNYGGDQASNRYRIRFKTSNSDQYGSATESLYYLLNVESELTIEVDLKFKYSAIMGTFEYLKLIANSGGEDYETGDLITPYSTAGSEAYAYVTFKGTYKTGALPAGTKLYIEIGAGKGGMPVGDTYSGGTIKITHAVDQIVYPWTRYPIVVNLPDIKQIDFLKMICAMYGYTVNAGSYGLNFVKIATVVENAGYTFYDWSDKMIKDTTNASYALNDFAQRNWIRWKESDEGISEDAAYIPVNNNTLTAEKDLIKFPLSNSKGSEIPCYSYNKDGELEYKACKNRIMLAYRRPDGKVGLTFNGLNAAALLSQNYTAYEQLIGRPFITKATFRLTASDLKNINIYRPVYLSHYGYYFAIISISNNNGVSEVELLKI